MPLSWTIDKRFKEGKYTRILGSVAFDDAYPSGGEDFSAGMDNVLRLTVSPSQGFVFDTDYTNKKIKAFIPTPGSDSFVYQFTGSDIKGSTVPAGTEGAADQNSAPVNSALVATLATFTAMAGEVTVAANPDMARNLVFTVKNDSGGALNLYEGTMTILITGTFRGKPQSETLTWVSTSGNKEIANSKYRFIAGVKPFDTVDSITYDNAAEGGLKLSVGVGSKLGLPANTYNSLESDFTKVTVDAADQVVTGRYNSTNHTYNIGTCADGCDFSIGYNVDASPVVTGAMGEVGNGTDLSAITAAPFDALLLY